MILLKLLLINYMPDFTFELTEEQMVEELSEFQRLARQMISEGGARPYSKQKHERSVDALLKKMAWLAGKGDIV